MAATCGIATMSLVLGALEFIWQAQVDQHARGTARHGAFGSREVRAQALDDHERLLAAITAGDIGAAERVAREHMSESHHKAGKWEHDFDMSVPVDAAVLR
jgi:DNA-binding FadR family transcriptional regulator